MQEYVDVATNFFKEYGMWGMFIHAMIDAIIFPIPAFFLQVALSAANPELALWYAIVGYIACLLGTPIGYLIGKLLGTKFLFKILKRKWVESASAMFKKNGDAAILIGAFTPIPFKVFTILSGTLNFSLIRLILFAAIGRAFKFFAVGILFYLYGQHARFLIENYLTYIFLAISVVLTVIWISKRKLQAKKARKIELDKENING